LQLSYTDPERTAQEDLTPFIVGKPQWQNREGSLSIFVVGTFTNGFYTIKLDFLYLKDLSSALTSITFYSSAAISFLLMLELPVLVESIVKRNNYI
jgi:hypothetical protein